MSTQNYSQNLETTGAAHVCDAGVGLAAGLAMADTVVHRMTGVTANADGHAVGMPFIKVQEGQSLVDVEEYLPAPVYPRGNTTLKEAGSFINFVDRFKDPETIIYANRDNNSFVAVLDHTTRERTARWQNWRAFLKLKVTPRFKEWLDGNGKPKTQIAFAEFIESHTSDVAAPDGVDLLQMVRNLEVKKNVVFQSTNRVEDGSTQLTFNENVEGTIRGGQMKVPTELALGLRVYEGGERYRVDAKLRFRLQDGKLTLWYELQRLDEVQEAAFDDVLKQVNTALPEVLILHGDEPPAL